MFFRKKMAFLFLIFALLTPNLIYADSEINSNSDDIIIYKNNGIKDTKVISSGKNPLKVRLDNQDFQFSVPNFTSDVTNKRTGENLTILGTQSTQLLEVKKKKDGTYTSSLVTTYSTATDATTAQKWLAGVTNYVTVYYHEDYHPSTGTKHVDMNYIVTSWSVPASAFVSNRSLLMYQKGKSNYGSHLSNASKTVYPSMNSAQSFNVPDEWIPIFEGLVGANANSIVITGGLSYSLSVKCNIMGG